METIKPKFKVGDTIVAKCDGFWKIDYIQDGKYLVTDILSGLTGYVPIKEQDVWSLMTDEDKKRYGHN